MSLTILDAPEARFPLRLGIENKRIRELFHNATRQQWNPATEIAWDELHPEQYDDAHLRAARMYWSRRAWGEYGAISESPALQIRFCQEHCVPDMALFFSIRSQEEARHAEVCWRMAEALGGYFEEPAATAFQGSVATHGIRKMALDPTISLEGTIAALVCAAEEIAFDVFRHLIDITVNPVARHVTRMILRDEVRHCAFGWAYMEQRMPQLTADEREGVRQAVITMIEKVELNGYHSSWLAPETPASSAEVEVDRLTWEAGLGATTEELEKPVFLKSIAVMRERMAADWGLEIPMFRHRKFAAPF
ncbi:MAG TPA: ferritin-like domain-containing protein [Caldimonas sp.]|nr:ferritin-like domain-containing protein [Caldimonas sp.]